MLKNIKSQYFIKMIFSILDDGSKLKIIRYNKNLQNHLDINLMNYKRFSGRFIKYITNKKVREYSSYGNYGHHRLIYEGEYLNGKRNGKGIEFDSKHGIIMYEGEYLNGKRHGKGKEYGGDNGNLIFEGEFLCGKRWTGKIYDTNEDGKINKVIYELKDGKGFVHEEHDDKYFIGEYLNGEKNGKGKEYYKYYLIYEGEYLNGKRHGKGREYAKNYLIFEGEYYNGKRWNGKTNVENSNIKYELKNGKGYSLQFIFSGHVWDEGSWLEGEYVNGELNGKAKEYNENGRLIFEGEYINGKRNGKCKEYGFEGNYLYDQKIEGKK